MVNFVSAVDNLRDPADCRPAADYALTSQATVTLCSVSPGRVGADVAARCVLLVASGEELSSGAAASVLAAVAAHRPATCPLLLLVEATAENPRPRPHPDPHPPAAKHQSKFPA